MSEERGSVAFDRAAEYYDETRGLSDEGVARQTAILSAELGGRGRVLDVGIGTGQVALPLSAAGIPVTGIDLSRPMLGKLLEKVEGRSPVLLAQSDALRLPFREGAFGAAYLRWVLHLIPDWRAALGQIARALVHGGVVLVQQGAAGTGSRQGEIRERFAELAGVSFEPIGLTWSGYEELDEVMASLGGAPRSLPAFTDVERDGLDDFIDSIARNRYSWTWKVEDPALRAGLAEEVRRWAVSRYGPLDQVPRDSYEVAWRAYDLPA